MRLVVSGYYGAGNLGDEALLAGLLAGLARIGTFESTVLSAAPSATRRLHGVAAAHRVTGALGALARADALVSGGGGLLQDATSGRSLAYYLGLVRGARLLGRPAVVYGQSLGPLSARGRRAVQRALTGLPLALRDRPSLELADELGLEAVSVGDAALLLDAAAHDVGAGGRTMVVLVPRGGYPRATDVLAGVAALASRRGLDVGVAAFHPREDDREVARLLARTPSARRLPARTPHEARTALGQAHLVVAARLHGLVLAAVAGAPHAGISYDPKVRGFAEGVGAPCWDVPRDEGGVAAVVGAVGELLADPPFDAGAVARARTEAAAGVAWLARTVSADGARSAA